MASSFLRLPAKGVAFMLLSTSGPTSRFGMTTVFCHGPGSWSESSLLLQRLCMFRAYLQASSLKRVVAGARHDNGIFDFAGRIRKKCQPLHVHTPST